MTSKDQILQVLQNKAVLVGVASALSMAAGATLGYRVAEKKLSDKYAELAEAEIESAKDFYQQLHKTAPDGKPMSPQEVAEDRLPDEAMEALRSYKGEALIRDEEEAESVEEVATTNVTVNVFTSKDDGEELPDGESGWDYETERNRRTGNVPYVITEEEFFHNERDYEQAQLTYFEGDDVVIDSADDKIEDIEKMIGSDNLTRFGMKSSSKDIVYIRNDALEVEFEIVKDSSSYTEKVLGFIEHSDKPGTRKFRRYDE